MTTFLSSPVFIAFSVTLLAALATVIGALVVVNANRSNPRLLAFGLAFAGGAMVYVSLVEILGKSAKSFGEVYGEAVGYRWAAIAFFCGIALLALIDRLIPNPHAGLDKPAPDGSAPLHDPKKVARVGLLAALAITAHNFPEGLATFFATLDSPVVGAPLAIAIAVHNIPEGVSIAIPVYYATGSKAKAVLAVFGSAMAEPVGALIGYAILAPFLSPPVFGAVFGLIAGVMVFLALDELLPAAKRYGRGHETTYGMVLGMALIALSLVLFK